MCVCTQKVPAKTASGNIGRSPQTTDQTVSRNTVHQNMGRYGFHASVSR
jgi:hypothetical protein